jgi:hypothetical protein
MIQNTSGAVHTRSLQGVDMDLFKSDWCSERGDFWGALTHKNDSAELPSFAIRSCSHHGSSSVLKHAGCRLGAHT